MTTSSQLPLQSNRVKWISAAAFAVAISLTACSSNESRTDVTEPPSGTVEYDSNQLMMKSADEISSMVRKRIKKAQDIQAKQETSDDGGILPEVAALRHLRDAMRIVLARPEQDGTRAAAFSQLRRELQDLNAVESTLNDLAKEGIAAIKAPNVSIRRQGTYLVILENLIAETRPEISTNAEFKRIITTIRDAKLKLSDKLRSQALLNAMTKPVSPSETAEKILDEEEARLKAEQKEEKKRAKKK